MRPYPRLQRRFGRVYHKLPELRLPLVLRWRLAQDVGTRSASVDTSGAQISCSVANTTTGKGAGDTGDGLMGGSGLQYLIASNMHLLSDAIYRGFEVPILHELDSYKEKTAENEASYKKEANEKSKELRKREAQHLKLARQKRRSMVPGLGAH